jgi:methionyl aminopeptidase
MVTIKTAHEIEIMRRAGAIAAKALYLAGKAIRPGISTLELNKIIHEYITSQGASPSFLGYGGFPGSACISLNDEVIHGIPGKRKLRRGDIVKIDVGACIDGYHSDCANTFAVGKISAEAKKLMDSAKYGFFKGLEQMVPGNRLGDVGNAIQQYVEQQGFSIVRDFVGHGIGTSLHEDPNVPNFGIPGHGLKLMPGMVLAVEPMVNAGTYEVQVLDDNWTVVTKDRSLSAHFEHTVAITDSGPKILTLPNEEAL